MLALSAWTHTSTEMSSPSRVMVPLAWTRPVVRQSCPAASWNDGRSRLRQAGQQRKKQGRKTRFPILILYLASLAVRLAQVEVWFHRPTRRVVPLTGVVHVIGHVVKLVGMGGVLLRVASVLLQIAVIHFRQFTSPVAERSRQGHSGRPTQ